MERDQEVFEGLEYIIEMENFMKKTEIEKENYFIQQDNMSEALATFSFYDFNTFFKFLSQPFNCVSINAYNSFKEWFKQGINNHNYFLLYWFKNSHMYQNIALVSKCMCCNDIYDSDPIYRVSSITSHYRRFKNIMTIRDIPNTIYNRCEPSKRMETQSTFYVHPDNDFDGYKMYPILHKIIVKYYRNFLYDDFRFRDGLKVEISIPMICEHCVPNANKYRYHVDFQTYLRINQCRALQTLESYSLCEPNLKHSIMRYLC